MTGLESALPTQPVVKDIRTLKANLKEQEKRARSENVAHELLPGTEPQPIEDEEQRKRQKVNNPVEANQDPEVVVLDGPLPPIKGQTKPPPNPSSPSKTQELQQNDAEVATLDSNSPIKAADATEPSPPSKPVVDASSAAQSKISDGHPEVTSNSESSEKPAVCKSESLANDQKNPVESTEAEGALPESKESSTKVDPTVETEKGDSS